MKFFLIPLSFFWAFNALSSDKTASPRCVQKPVFISIGAWCVPALFLRQFKLREAAYPFDWLTTGAQFENLYRVIQNNFADFLHKENLYIDPQSPQYVQDRGTNFSIAHDFPKDQQHNILPQYLDAYESVKAKYQRRIQRFKDTLASGKKVIFIRIDNQGQGTPQQAEHLRDLIASKYPQLDFVCIQLGYTDEYKTPWNLDHIKNYYIDAAATAGPPNWNHYCWRILLHGIEETTGCSIADPVVAQPGDDK